VYPVSTQQQRLGVPETRPMRSGPLLRVSGSLGQRDVVGQHGLQRIAEEDDVSAAGGCSVAADVSNNGDAHTANLQDFSDVLNSEETTWNSCSEAALLAQLTKGVSEDAIVEVLADEMLQEKKKMEEALQKAEANAEQALAEIKQQWSEQEELVKRLAMSDSKTERLKQTVEAKEVIIDNVLQSAEALRSAIVHKDGVLRVVQEKLDAEQQKLEHKEIINHKLQMQLLEKHVEEDVLVTTQDAQQLEDVEQQLATALEARRVACARSEDYKIAIQTMGARHAAEVGDLCNQVNLWKAAAAHAKNDEEKSKLLIELQEKVQHLWEERNMLQNTLEWKEVHWRSMMDALEMQLASQSQSCAPQK